MMEEHAAGLPVPAWRHLRFTGGMNTAGMTAGAGRRRRAGGLLPHRAPSLPSYSMVNFACAFSTFATRNILTKGITTACNILPT